MIEKPVTILLVIFILIMIPTVSSFAGVCGDINDDGGDPDISDLVYLVDYMFQGGPPPPLMWAADVDGSGGAFPDIADLVYLVDFMFLGGPAPNCITYTTPTTTTIIPEDDSTTIIGYDTSGTVFLDESSSYAQEVSVGDVIIGQDDEEAPNGFLRKISSKTTQGGSVILETQQATMMEAFESMHINETHQLRPSDIRWSKLISGSRLQSGEDDETFIVPLDCVFYDQDGNPGTTDDQIRLDGEYAFTAALFAEIDFEWFTLSKFETGIETSQDVDIDLTANLQWQFSEEVEFDLAEIHFGAIPVGGVVWLVPTLTVEAHIHGDLTITFETGITYNQVSRYGFGYADDAFYGIDQSTQSFTYTPPQFTTEFNFEPGVSLNASCLLYGVAGPYMAGKAGFHFESILVTDPCGVDLTFDLEAIAYAVVGIECDILGLDYNQQFELYAHLLGEWTYRISGTGTILIDPEPNSLNAPWSLEGPCSYNTSGTGDETLNWLDPGDYTVIWGVVSGWIAPSSEVQTLAVDETVTFTGTYGDGTGTVTDIDGNVYQTVTIGPQEWMAENLKVTHYRNGDAIPNVTDSATWLGLSTGAYCNYNNDAASVAVYGRLYNWFAADDSRSIAPEGWHVPSKDEWWLLTNSLYYLGSEGAVGGKMKETGTTHWISPNSGATNESGFTGLPGGRRSSYYGIFGHLGDRAFFWSTADASGQSWNLNLYYNSDGYHIWSDDRESGFSVRCVKD